MFLLPLFRRALAEPATHGATHGVDAHPSPPEANGKRPCKVCKGFGQAFHRFHDSKNPSPSAVQDRSSIPALLAARYGCPENKDTLGRAGWSLLHTQAAYYPEKPEEETKRDMRHYLDLFAKFYPCDYCSKHLKWVLQEVTRCFCRGSIG